MKARLFLRLMKVEPRMLLAAMGVLIVLIAFESWVLVLRAPLAEWRALAATRTALQATAPNAGLSAEIESLVVQTATTARALATALPVRSDDATVLALIDTLGRNAGRHAVALGSIKVGRRTAFSGVEEQSYEIEARGEYRALHAWLSEARGELAPLVVGGLALRSIDDGKRAGMTLTLAAYRTASTPRSAP